MKLRIMMSIILSRRNKTLNFAVALFLISLAVLLNIADPNPTGRRYSSQTPGGTSANDKGVDGERILAKDLAMTRNEQDPQCICDVSGAVKGRCTSCFAQLPIQANYRIPDFVHPLFIAESKNRATMPADETALLQQIEDYALTAQVMNVPLWIYVRTNSSVDPIYYTLAQATGGDVIHYFTTKGYVDPLDWMAVGGILMAFVLSLATLVADRLRARPI